MEYLIKKCGAQKQVLLINFDKVPPRFMIKYYIILYFLEACFLF